MTSRTVSYGFPAEYEIAIVTAPGASWSTVHFSAAAVFFDVTWAGLFALALFPRRGKPNWFWRHVVLFCSLSILCCEIAWGIKASTKAIGHGVALEERGASVYFEKGGSRFLSLTNLSSFISPDYDAQLADITFSDTLILPFSKPGFEKPRPTSTVIFRGRKLSTETIELALEQIDSSKFSVLIISTEELSGLPDVSRCQNLKRIYFNGTQFKDVSTDARNLGSRVEYLDLAYSNISLSSVLKFLEAPALREIDITGCGLDVSRVLRSAPDHVVVKHADPLPSI
ncbi:hypothetical protein [Roseimaritima multifibrata]|nr:hypothetical protein [Roseimaritima multifibrata]